MSTKAQAWYMDFSIALLLFIFTLTVYFSYTTNFQKQEKGELDSMISDAKSISSSLVLKGYPLDWGNTTVIRIGIANEQNINVTKLKSFAQLNYSNTKKIFGTYYNYFIFFENNNGEVLNIKGLCGVGSNVVTTTYNIKSAYYYQDPSDSFLKDFMNQTFKADIYFDDIDGLSKNLSKYSFLVMEHPLLSASDFSTYGGKLENYTLNGGLFMISGELATPATNNMAGADFKKKAGQSSSQRTAIVNYTDDYLSLTVGQSMVFNQYYYVVNTSALDFNLISTFNQTNDKAIARWKYGNGTVYFFSDFDVTFFSGNFVNIVEDAAKSLTEGTCNPINITGINPAKLVKIERYVNYNSKTAKMIVYLWG